MWTYEVLSASRVYILKPRRIGFRFDIVAYSSERTSVSVWRRCNDLCIDLQATLRASLSTDKTLDNTLLCWSSLIFSLVPQHYGHSVDRCALRDCAIALLHCVCHPPLSTMWEMLHQTHLLLYSECRKKERRKEPKFSSCGPCELG